METQDLLAPLTLNRAVKGALAKSYPTANDLADAFIDTKSIDELRNCFWRGYSSHRVVSTKIKAIATLLWRRGLVDLTKLPYLGCGF